MLDQLAEATEPRIEQYEAFSAYNLRYIPPLLIRYHSDRTKGIWSFLLTNYNRTRDRVWK